MFELCFFSSEIGTETKQLQFELFWPVAGERALICMSIWSNIVQNYTAETKTQSFTNICSHDQKNEIHFSLFLTYWLYFTLYDFKIVYIITSLSCSIRADDIKKSFMQK